MRSHIWFPPRGDSSCASSSAPAVGDPLPAAAHTVLSGSDSQQSGPATQDERAIRLLRTRQHDSETERGGQEDNPYCQERREPGSRS